MIDIPFLLSDIDVDGSLNEEVMSSNGSTLATTENRSF